MKRLIGFTLLELAIVLMVLALLVGGILMWQESDGAPAPTSPIEAR